MNKKVFAWMLALLVSTVIFAQDRTVMGKVTDEVTGSEIPGVTVLIKGTTSGTTTNLDGVYQLKVSDGSTLIFSFSGYEAQEIVLGARSVVDVTMMEYVGQLGEVVVTAFGIERGKKALGYAVTQVEGDQFVNSRPVNLGNALAGKVAGVNVSAPSTGAAGSSRVTIRGSASLSGNDQPLYVINGVPIDNSTLGSAGLWGGNDGGDGLNSLNPDDIESISVLKGNSAAALYGARAANGVILITTKSGKSINGIEVSFNSNLTFDNVIDRTDWQKEYGTGSEGIAPTDINSALEFGGTSWGAKLDGSEVVQFDGEARAYSNMGEGLNDFYRTGQTWTNTLALAGGDENGGFRFSASDLNNKDIVPNAGFKKQSFNVSLNRNFNNKLELRVNGQYSKEQAENRPRLSDSPGNANFTALMKPANISFETLKGLTSKLGAKEDGTELRSQDNIFVTNPYWATYQFRRFDVKDRFFGNALLKYNIFEWLYIQGRVGTDIVSIDSDRTEAYGTAYKSTGDYNKTFRKIREDNYDFLIGFNKSFENIELGAIIGGNKLVRSDESSSIGGNGLNIPFFNSVTNVTNQSYGYSLRERGINSIYGAVDISYNNLVFLNLAGRQDKFSTLSELENTVFYPSANLSFVFSDAINMPGFFSFGKIRAAWGQVGGGATTPYLLDLNYGLVDQGHNGAVLGRISNESIPNANLKPFLSTELEFGIDIRFFNNRLGLDAAYYSKKTTDDILNTTISSTSGFGSATINIGELSNNGLELLVTGTPVSTRNVKWDVSFNYANNISKVVNLGVNAVGDPIQFLNLDQARTRQEQIRHYLGQQLGVIAGYKHKTDENGVKVYNDEGYPVRSDGFEILGNGRHPVSYGFSSSLSYKNFSLSFLIDGRSGGSIMSGTNVLAYSFGVHKGTLEGRENGLTITGVNTEGTPQTWNIPKENVDNYYGEYNNITEYFVYDGSFAKLRELSISYSIPLVDKIGLKSAVFSVVGRNLLLLWSNVPNVDPESAYSNTGGSQGLEFFALPTARQVGFNLALKF